MRAHASMLAAAFLAGLGISACNADSEGTMLAQPCINDLCPLGFECSAGYCFPIGSDTDTDPGDGDGDPTPGDGDGDGDPTTGDGDGDPTTGDGDGDPTTGDGDGDPCQPGTLGCPCDAGVCAPNLICDLDYICAEEVCGDGFIAEDEDCEGDDLQGVECEDLGDYGGGTLACDPETCAYDTSDCVFDGCGDGNVDIGEQCDGIDLQGYSCMDLGYSGGDLGCDPITCTFDASDCFV